MSDSMRILQLPTEIAGQANLTARGLREIGYEAYNAAKKNPFGYPVDISSCFRTLDRVRNPLLFFAWLERFDVFHYHKSPFLPRGIDIRILKKRHKAFTVEFWGSDIRIHAIEQSRNRFFAGDNIGNQDKKKKRLEFWSGMTDQVIMSDNAMDIFLKPYFSKIHIVRQRVDTAAFKPVYPDPGQRRPVIVHAPSVAAVKGTQFVERAIGALERKKLAFDYVRVKSLPHHEAMEAYRRADIIVDQLALGSHGVFACEAMALGKPVVCYILDELLPTYPAGFPVVNANPETIDGVLEELVLSPERRHRIGRDSRAYAERVHDIRQVARRLVEIYRAL